MNNILELCKIFNCKLNDLVHTDMSDISSLDKEIVMNAVKFNESKQNQVKTLSNVISLIGKIGGIVLKVAIPFIVITMILVPFIVNNTVVNGDDISFTTDKIKYIDENRIELYNFILVELDDDISLNEIVNIFNNNSNFEIIVYLEVGLVFLLINIVIMIIILKFVEKLFNNIKNNKTPFVLENVNFIKKISYLMIALIVINPISEILFSEILGITNTSGGFELISILEILIIFSMSYIFEYGYEIQKDSKGIMYN